MIELKKSGKTIIISTHDESLADMLCDKAVYLNDEHKVELWYKEQGTRYR